MKQYFILNGVFLFFMLYSIEVTCQSYESKKISINHDLESKVRDKTPYIDDDGFLWYTIREGIVKEQGTMRIVYPMKAKNNSNYYCHTIYKTSKNILWVGTNIGAYSLDLNTGESFWLQRIDEKKNDFIEFTSFIENPDGAIWMGTKRNKLFLYTLEGKTKLFTIDKSFYDKVDAFTPLIIKEILEDGSLFLIQRGKCFQFKNEKFELLLNFNKTTEVYDGLSVVSFSPQKNRFKADFSGTYTFLEKKYYYYYLKGINKFIASVPHGKAIVIDQKKRKISSELFRVAAISGDKIIISSIQVKNNKVVYKEQKEVKTEVRIFSMRLDHENNILTQNINGFYITKILKPQFETFLNDKKEYGLKNAISCRSIIEQSDGSIIVFNVYNDFFKLTKNSNKFKKLAIGNEISLNLYGAYKQNDSIIWGYGFGRYLYEINLKASKNRRYLSKMPGPIEYNVYDIAQIDDSKLIIGGSFGLQEFNLKTKQFKAITTIGKDTIINKPVGELYFDKQENTLWVGMLDNYGLYKMNLSQNKTMHFSSKNKRNPLVNDNIRYVYKSKQNTIWVGTENGMQNIPKKNASSSRDKIVITDENITGVFEKENSVWYATYNGLKKLNKATNKIESFYEYDGLPDNEFNYKSVLEDSQGNIYLGGINGLVRFNPEKVSSENKRKRIFLTEVNKFEEENSKNKEGIYNLKALKNFQIPYSNNYITLKFAINDLFNFQRNTYYYRIKKINKEWVSLGNNGVIQLNGISPDTYTLEVKGKQPNGVETNTLTYKINIEQIFYKTWWFITGVIFLLVLSLLGISFYKIKQIKKKANQRVKLLDLEARALRAQMNSHFIFNILNSLQNSIIEGDEREINSVFSGFSKLIRYTLNMSRIEFISLEEEINYLKTYVSMEKIRLNNELEIKFEITENIVLKTLKIPCMLFQPIIENAIIHGLKPKRNNRKLEVLFNYSKNYLTGVIKDNGIGREASNKHKGKEYNSVGTHILKERLEILNYQKRDKIKIVFIDLKEKEIATGSIVKLIIPINI